MTLATIIMGLFLLGKGITILTFRSEAAYEKGLCVLRNKVFDGVLTAIAAAWFLWVVLHLGQADFGDYKNFMFVVFLTTAVGSWYLARDFLGVRAACVIFMLAAWHFLGAAFAHYEAPARLFMVSAVYVGLVFALYLAAAPYRARDLMEWFTRHPKAAVITGSCLAAYGAWLLVIPVCFY